MGSLRFAKARNTASAPAVPEDDIAEQVETGLAY